jgi:DNA-binding NarL/FixJ family response regulator
VEAGAAGIIDKASAVSSIVEALRRVAEGASLIDTQEVLALIRGARSERERLLRGQELAARLTPREREVLQALADGLNNREIAQRLHISVETQRTHMVNILGKLGAHSQLQALVIAVRHGIVHVT